jgi:glycosyltransferase involved in cell wall biosynthesis
VLFLGNLFAEKGVFEVIEAVRILYGKIRRPIQLTFIGGIPDEGLKAKIESVFQTLPDGVEIVGPTEAYGADKWRVLANADTFVFPSYYERENVPLVVIEAMACACPVIATRWRGIPSLVEDGLTGFLVEPKDPEAIAERLAELEADPEMAERLGRNGRKRFEEAFTMASHFKAMEGLFQEALADN